MRRRFIDVLRELHHQTSSPHQLALGFTLGLALSLVPIPVVGGVLGLGAAGLTRANLLAAYLGTVLVNPLTGPFVFFAELFIGLRVFGQETPSWAALRDYGPTEWWQLAQAMAGPFAVGAALCVGASVLLGYPLAYAAARWLRARKASAV